MSTYLLEIGCEEIPSRFVKTLLDDLKARTKTALTSARIAYESVETFGTYRRLVVSIQNIALSQSDVEETLTGPPASMAFDASGALLPPGLGFAKKNNIDPATLIKVTKNGQEYVGTQVYHKGRPTSEVLSKVMTEVVTGVSLPIAMRWGSHSATFFRPVHWIVSLLDETVIPLTLFDIHASNVSHGHRLLTDHPNPRHVISGIPISIHSPATYMDQLYKAYVMVDPTQREALIVSGLTQEMDASAIVQETLEEVIYLVEWPTLIKGEFDPKYLEIPDQVLSQCIKKHQKYFPIFNRASHGTNQFIVVAENVTPSNRATIIAGNQQVLTARLEDVTFFWKEDTATPLDHLLPKLDTVVFQKGLGSITDKVTRMQALATTITQDLGWSSSQADITRTIALCKADLVSQMVFELPDLQGIMGSIYASKQGETQAVVDGINQHYMPRFALDKIPTSSTGIVCALADKLDTIVASFYNGIIPTGSQDPFGIRRAVYGIAKIIMDANLNINLLTWIDSAYSSFGEAKNKEKLIQFITQRFQSFLQEKNLPYDTVEAVLDVHPFNLITAYDIATQIETLKKDPASFKSFMETAVRITRLAQKAPLLTPISDALFQLPEELTAFKIYQALTLLSPLTITDLHRLTPPMTAYFDKVLVMDKDDTLKQNRLSFIAHLAKMYATVANFERIV